VTVRESVDVCEVVADPEVVAVIVTVLVPVGVPVDPVPVLTLEDPQAFSSPTRESIRSSVPK